MIVVKLELWPNGDKSKARPLGVAEITNDCQGTLETGSYSVRLLKWGPAKRTWKVGRLRGFPRLLRGPWDLLLCALVAVVGDRVKGLEVDVEYMGEIEAAEIRAQPQELFENKEPRKPGHAG